MMSPLMNYQDYEKYLTAVYVVEGVTKKGWGAFVIHDAHLVHNPVPFRIIRYVIAAIESLFQKENVASKRLETEKKTQYVTQAIVRINETHKKLENIDFSSWKSTSINHLNKNQHASLRAALLYNHMYRGMSSWQKTIKQGPCSAYQRILYWLEKKTGLTPKKKDRLSIPSLSSIGNHWKAIPLPLLSPPSDPKNQTFLIDSLFLRDNRFSPTITKIMRTFLLKMGLFPDKQEFTAHNGLGTHSLERDFPYCNTPLNLSSLEHGLETIFLCTRATEQKILCNHSPHYEIKPRQMFHMFQRIQSPETILDVMFLLQQWYGNRLPHVPQVSQDLHKKGLSAIAMCTPYKPIAVPETTDYLSIIADLEQQMKPTSELFCKYCEIFSEIPISQKKRDFFDYVIGPLVRQQPRNPDSQYRQKLIQSLIFWAEQTFLCNTLSTESIRHKITEWVDPQDDP